MHAFRQPPSHPISEDRIPSTREPNTQQPPSVTSPKSSGVGIWGWGCTVEQSEPATLGRNRWAVARGRPVSQEATAAPLNGFIDKVGESDLKTRCWQGISVGEVSTGWAHIWRQTQVHHYSSEGERCWMLLTLGFGKRKEKKNPDSGESSIPCSVAFFSFFFLMSFPNSKNPGLCLGL